MSEKEKQIAKATAELIPKLSDPKKEYLLGFIEGMTAAKDQETDKAS